MAFRRTQRSTDSKRAADPDAVREAAIALLARRDFASGELREKLRSRGYDPAIAAAVVADLTEERVLDDARYAENYVAYHAGRGHGPLRIGADLRSFGLRSELIDAALAAGQDWRALARAIRARKFGDQPPEDWTEKVRQARFLQYRGFSADHIRAVTGAELDPD
jgi:regulatory protein